jgi:hypothetical protein
VRIIIRLAVQWFQLKGSIEAAVSRGASLDCLFELSAYRKSPVSVVNVSDFRTAILSSIELIEDMGI